MFGASGYIQLSSQNIHIRQSQPKRGGMFWMAAAIYIKKDNTYQCSKIVMLEEKWVIATL